MKTVYMWTEKVEKLSNGKRKAGEVATVLGRPLKECELAESWLAAGWIEVKKDGA